MKGPVGTGKTTLAVAILRESIAQGKGGFMISMPSLLDTLLTLSKGSNEQFLQFENKIRNTPLLILDDFGAEYKTDWVSAKVDAIITERYNREKPIIITSNLSTGEIFNKYNQRIYDRLKSTCKILTFIGASHRKELA